MPVFAENGRLVICGPMLLLTPGAERGGSCVIAGWMCAERWDNEMVVVARVAADHPTTQPVHTAQKR